MSEYLTKYNGMMIRGFEETNNTHHHVSIALTAFNSLN